MVKTKTEFGTWLRHLYGVPELRHGYKIPLPSIPRLTYAVSHAIQLSQLWPEVAVAAQQCSWSVARNQVGELAGVLVPSAAAWAVLLPQTCELIWVWDHPQTMGYVYPKGQRGSWKVVVGGLQVNHESLGKIQSLIFKASFRKKSTRNLVFYMKAENSTAIARYPDKLEPLATGFGGPQRLALIT